MATEKTTEELAAQAAKKTNEASGGAKDNAATSETAPVSEPQFDDGGDGDAYKP